jgi:hypothetical protein
MTDSLIEGGIIKKMAFLKGDSLPDLLKLQGIIAENLPCPEIFMLHDEEYFLETLHRERSVIGISTPEGLVAYSIIRIPGFSPDGTDGNLGRDINLPREDLETVAHLQAIAVHPACRGFGLQRRLAGAHLRVIEELGYKHVCCTVSPKNPVSLANMLSRGLMIENLRPKFDGWCRYILHKDLLQTNAPAERGLEVSLEECCIPISDLSGQANLLKRGFKGLKVMFSDQGAEIIYGKI